MTPQDLIRAAAKIIETQGWCSGTDNKGKIVHVRDQSGIALPLYRGDNTGQDKAKVNPGARSFSIYGALCKAIHDARGAVADPGGMWTVLQGIAMAETGAERAGGTNWLHPVIGINEREGQTKDGVLAFLERCAVEFEDVQRFDVEIIPPGPYVDPRQRGAEPLPPSASMLVHVPPPEPDPAAFQQVWPTENTSDLVAMQGDEAAGHIEIDDGVFIPVKAPTPQIKPEPIYGFERGEIRGMPEPVKAPVASPKAEPAVEAVKSRLPPVNWGE